MHETAKNDVLTTALAVGVLLLTTLLAAPAVAMNTAQDYFEDGNRLFRSDLYWAALLRYEQAADAGLDTPLLHYNTGVAHYRAGQHLRAREELLLALTSNQLRDAAHYSLGLNAFALGQHEEALRWFSLVRDQQNNEKLAEYAGVAIARVLAVQKPDPIEKRVVERQRKDERKFADLEFRTRVGFGTDDNVYRTPSQNYIDFSDPNLPLITPEVQSGTFVPVSLSAQYNVNSFKYEGFYGAYRMAGRYYTDELLENANEYLHEFSFGNEYRRRKEGREREVYSAFKIAQHDEVYYDPDDGVPRSVGGEPIDDRMNYLRYGPELRARQAHKRLAFGMKIKGQLWNYEETGVVPEYDHEYFEFGLDAQYKFTKTSLLRVEVEKYSRRYGDRPSYDLDGAQRVGNPNVRYDYVSAALTARQRLFDNLWFGLDYERSERTDRYVGYNDYTRDSYGFELHWRLHERFDLELGGFYRIYDYPNAFAFNNPIAGRKTYESAFGSVMGTFDMTATLSLVAEASYRGAASTDTRLAYDRYQYVLGIRWQPN
ncbi:MAG: hypothetical protein WBN09_12900 [Woeseiaceae bacterium]